MNRTLRLFAFLIISTIVIISLLVLLKYDKPSRYQIITAGGIIELMDIKTSDVYYNYGTEWHRVSLNGVDVVVSKLPK